MQKFICHTPFYSKNEGRMFERGDWTLIENNNVMNEDGKTPSTPVALREVGTFTDFSFTQFAPTLDWGKLKAGDRVLIHRIGGLGDITHAAPIVYELEERGAVIEFCYRPDFTLLEPFLFGTECEHSTRSRQDYGVVPVEADWTVNLESCVEANDKPIPVLDLYLQRTLNPPAALLDPANRMTGGKYITKCRANIEAFLEEANIEPGEQHDLVLSPYSTGPVRSAHTLANLPTPFLREHSAVMIGVAEPVHTSPIPIYDKLEPARLYQMLLNSRLVVTADNGVSHLAYWLGLPMIAIYSMMDWRARLYPSKHVCIVNASDLCPMAPCWWQNMICPLLMGANMQVPVCSALMYLASSKIAELIAMRIKPGDKTFLEVNGASLAGMPDFVVHRKGLRNADGSPYEAHS